MSGFSALTKLRTDVDRASAYSYTQHDMKISSARGDGGVSSKHLPPVVWPENKGYVPARISRYRGPVVTDLMPIAESLKKNEGIRRQTLKSTQVRTIHREYLGEHCCSTGERCISLIIYANRQVVSTRFDSL
jgi:hypothetical protein